MAGNLFSVVAHALTPDQVQDVKRRIIQAATQYRRGDRIAFPIAVRIVAARKPL